MAVRDGGLLGTARMFPDSFTYPQESSLDRRAESGGHRRPSVEALAVGLPSAKTRNGPDYPRCSQAAVAETNSLRSQIVTSNHGPRKTSPTLRPILNEATVPPSLDSFYSPSRPSPSNGLYPFSRITRYVISRASGNT